MTKPISLSAYAANYVAISDRERFCAITSNGPLLKGDAIVILAGEDAEPRVQFGAQLFKQGAAPGIVVTGGRSEPPHCLDAEACFGMLMGLGIAPDRILKDDAMHTREQAVNVVRLAIARRWTRVLVVASAYHVYRATLSFVAALIETGTDDRIHIVPVPASQTAWGESPDGVEMTRLDLLASEFMKIEAYSARGHVASYADAIRYFRAWEVERDAPKDAA